MPSESVAPPNAPFRSALCEGTAQEVAACLASGADPNEPISVPMRTNLPLEWALCRPGSPEQLAVIDVLLAAGADIHRPTAGSNSPVWQKVFTSGGSPEEKADLFRIFWKHHPGLGHAVPPVPVNPPYKHVWIQAASLTTDALLDELLAAAPPQTVGASVAFHLADNPHAWDLQRLQRLLAFVPEPRVFAFNVIKNAIDAPSYQGSCLPWVKWGLSAASPIDAPAMDFLIEHAARCGRLDALEVLLAIREPLATTPWERDPLLLTAATAVLPRAGARPDVLDCALAWMGPGNAQDKQGCNALHAVLVSAPQLLNLARPRHRAHLLRLARRLEAAGVSWNTPDGEGRTPLDLARQHYPAMAARWERENARTEARALRTSLPSSSRSSSSSRTRF